MAYELEEETKLNRYTKAIIMDANSDAEPVYFAAPIPAR
jgi:hypothetical protein